MVDFCDLYMLTVRRFFLFFFTFMWVAGSIMALIGLCTVEMLGLFFLF